MNVQATRETTTAFDSHALHYDALVEHNPLLQTMRAALWHAIAQQVPPPARLLDLGCGTGIDAVYFAGRGYTVTALDAAREMVNQARRRAEANNVTVRFENIGAQELDMLGDATFDAIYSDLGPLNCVANPADVSRQCAAHLAPGGKLIMSVMARVCPWEIMYYSLRGEFARASRRLPRQMVPVNLETGVVWTRYYDPREFYRFFENEFQPVTYRSLNLFLPPPYLLKWFERAGILGRLMAWLDAHLHSVPLLRDWGDHFLITLSKRAPLSTHPLPATGTDAWVGRTEAQDA